MERAIRVNTLVEKTTEAAVMFHAVATGSSMLQRKTSHGPAGREPRRVTWVTVPSPRAEALDGGRVRL